MRLNIQQIVHAVSPVFTAPLLWVGKIFGAITGMLEFYISCFVFALVIGMFIVPLRGAALRGSEASGKSGKKSAKTRSKEGKTDG